MSSGRIIKGTLIMAASGFVIKLIGFLFKIFLARLIGDSGYGIYTMAYSVYSPVLMLFVSGIPVAISQLVAQEGLHPETGGSRIFTSMLTFSTIFGLILSALFMGLAGPIAQLVLNDPLVHPGLLGIGPAIFFAALLAVFRGYFQGKQQMMPTAISQMVEQIIRVGGAFVLIPILVEYGLHVGVAGVTLAAGIGGFFGLLVLVGFYFWQRQWREISGIVHRLYDHQAVRKVMRLALPITLGALAISLMQFLDGTIIPRRLISGGASVDEARAIFGGFGMANSLISFPTILATAIAVNLIPAIAKSHLVSAKLTNYRIGQAIRWGGIIGSPASVGLFLLAKPAALLIFHTPHAVLPLQILSWAVLIITLHTVTTGILQGVGKTYLPARNLVLGGVANGLINYFLTPIWGIRGAALGTLLGYFISLWGNFRDLARVAGFTKLCSVIRPALLATVGMGIVVYVGKEFLQFQHVSRLLLLSLSVFLGISSYALLLFLLKGISIEEMKKLVLFDR